jgi:hypothetical protein
MGLKTNNSPIDMWLSKMEATIDNIVFFATVGNLAVNQLMECDAPVVVTTKAASAEEPNWTMVMANKMRPVVSRVVGTLVNAPKQEECKFNLCFMGFEAEEGETEK